MFHVPYTCHQMAPFSLSAQEVRQAGDEADVFLGIDGKFLIVCLISRCRAVARFDHPGREHKLIIIVSHALIMPPILRSRQAKQKESVGRANFESSGEASENTDSQYVPQVPREHSTSTTDSDPDSSGCSVPAGVNDADVLLGRGKGAYEHKGNRICTKIVASRIPKYAAASKNKVRWIVERQEFFLQFLSLFFVSFAMHWVPDVSFLHFVCCSRNIIVVTYNRTKS